MHAVNVPDNQWAVMRPGSLAASAGPKARGIEPIFQLTCRDRNRIALQSDLLTACSLGIDNVLLLTGDHIQLGDHEEAKPVFDLDSVQLINMARGLQRWTGRAARKKRLRLLGRFLRPIKSMVQGVHILPPGWTDIAPDLLAHAEIDLKKAA